MPILEITQEAIGPGRTHLVTDYIASVMLWPDDAEKRACAMKTSVAQHIRGTLTAIDDVPAARLDAVTRDVLYGMMLEALPSWVIAKGVRLEDFRNGWVAGELLGNVIFRRDASGPVKLDAIKHQIVERGARANAPPVLKISQSTVENTILRRLKPVMHLWAACCENALIYHDRKFPCALHRVPEFLAMAQLFLKAGRRTSLPPNAGRVLSGDAWELPATLTLPPVRFVQRG
jgi:hypothetical protein